MLIDCDECVMQHTPACDDCFVTVILDAAPHHSHSLVELDEGEAEAVSHLAEVGLVPQLRLVPRRRGYESGDSSSATG